MRKTDIASIETVDAEVSPHLPRLRSFDSVESNQIIKEVTDRYSCSDIVAVASGLVGVLPDSKATETSQVALSNGIFSYLKS